MENSLSHKETPATEPQRTTSMRVDFKPSLPEPGRERRQRITMIRAVCAACLVRAIAVASNAGEPPESHTTGHALGLMYWTNRNQGIYRAVRDGGEVTLVIEMPSVDGLAVDAKGGKLYFTTSTAPDSLCSANLDGTEVTELATGLNCTGDVVFDPRAKKLYVSSLVEHKILQVNTDGTDMKDFVTGLINPDELAIDLEDRFLYWSHSGRGGPIQRAKLDDASELADVITTRSGRMGIAIDTVSRQIYWVDVKPGNIIRSGLDGKGETMIVTGRVYLDGLALDTDNRKICWTETGKICQANLDGSGIEVLVPDKTDEFATLVILPPKE